MKKEDKNALLHALDYRRKFHFWTILYWDIFYPSKSKELLKHIINGMNWEAAFKTVKDNNKKIK